VPHAAGRRFHDGSASPSRDTGKAAFNYRRDTGAGETIDRCTDYATAD